MTQPSGHAAKVEALRRELGEERFEALKSLADQMLATKDSPAAVDETLSREARAMGVDASQLYWIAYSA